MWVSHLIELRLFSKEWSASPPRSLCHFNKVRATSPLQRLRLILAKQESCASVPSESCKFAFVTLRAAFLIERCVFTLKETCTLAKQQSRVSSTKSPRLHLEVCVTSTKRELLLHYDESELCFYFRRGPHLQGNMTFASTWPVFSLCFCNQFNNTPEKADDYSPSSTVH